MITKENVKHITKLARIGLTSKEIGKMQKELSAIFDYIGQLKEVDVSEVQPTTHSIILENVMREDKGQASKNAKRLIDAVPEREKEFVKVKSILS